MLIEWEAWMGPILDNECSPAIARRYRMRAQGIRASDVAEQEGITRNAVTVSIARAREAFKSHALCEICGREERLVVSIEDGKVCGRCYFMLRRVRLAIEPQEAEEEPRDMFLELINNH